MKREIYEVHANIVDSNGSYNKLSNDYPKKFDSMSYENDVDKALRRAESAMHTAAGTMYAVDSRQVQTTYIIRVSDGVQIEKVTVGKLADLPDPEPEPEPEPEEPDEGGEEEEGGEGE